MYIRIQNTVEPLSCLNFSYLVIEHIIYTYARTLFTFTEIGRSRQVTFIEIQL